jgi:hypothetical protein
MKAGLFQGHVVLVSHASREAIGELFDKKVGRR